MAEYTFNPVQVVQPNQPVILNDSIRCNKGYVIHRNESGIVTLRGIVNCPTNCSARYKVTFNGNIAVAEGATLTPISVALTQNGEAILTSKAIATPAAVAEPAPSDNNYFNITSTAIIDVPRGCCFNVSVENVTEINGATPAQPINVQNANLVVERIA